MNNIENPQHDHWTEEDTLKLENEVYGDKDNQDYEKRIGIVGRAQNQHLDEALQEQLKVRRTDIVLPSGYFPHKLI